MFSLFRLRSRTVRQVSLFRSPGSEVILFLQKVNIGQIGTIFWGLTFYKKCYSDIQLRLLSTLQFNIGIIYFWELLKISSASGGRREGASFCTARQVHSPSGSPVHGKKQYICSANNRKMRKVVLKSAKRWQSCSKENRKGRTGRICTPIFKVGWIMQTHC